MAAQLLHGVTAPPGSGAVVEVHLDIMDTNASFLEQLHHFGFEDDPFLAFYPPGYQFHYTGRTRVLPQELRAALSDIQTLAAAVFEQARALNVRLYAECELVREIHHFGHHGDRGLSALEGLGCTAAPAGAMAKADVHVEFLAGSVPQLVRQRMTEAGFYWVSTPVTSHFPSEEIATLQTSTFHDAATVFDRLVSQPLPLCTGIHLEQKLWMESSHRDVPLPPVMVPF